MKKLIGLAIVASVVSAVLAACSMPATSTKGGSSASHLPEVPPAEELLAIARRLGDTELRKMAAAEMLYHNQVFEHNVHEDTNITLMYAKFFRQFTDFEVDDIEKTDSILHPVRYRIRYKFDVLGTRVRRVEQHRDLGLIRQVAEDFYFIKHLEDSLVRIYESDAQGNPINPYSPVLDRLNYWQFQTITDLMGHEITLTDVTSLVNP